MKNKLWTLGDYVFGLDGISKNTLIEIFCNRDDNLYTNEVRSWVELLNYTFANNTIIHWSPFEDVLIYNNITNLSRIVDETIGLINDHHYSETGHIELAKVMKELLSNSKKNKPLI
jgi:hypothetical protein